MNFSIVIPHYGKNTLRLRNLGFTVSYFSKCFPDTEIIVSEQIDKESALAGMLPETVIHNTFQSDSKGFNKCKAINGAVRLAKNDIIVMCDNDCTTSKSAILKAVEYVSEHPLTLAYPFDSIKKLSEMPSRKLAAMEYSDEAYLNFSKNENSANLPVFSVKHYTGGINVFSKKLFDLVGGFDEVFHGWGGEDDAFMNKCRRLADKPVRVDDSVLVHMYHGSEMASRSYEDSAVNKKFVHVLRNCTKDELLEYVGGKISLPELKSKYDSNEFFKYRRMIRRDGTPCMIDVTVYDLPEGHGDDYTSDEIFDIINSDWATKI